MRSEKNSSECQDRFERIIMNETNEVQSNSNWIGIKWNRSGYKCKADPYSSGIGKIINFIILCCLSKNQSKSKN